MDAMHLFAIEDHPSQQRMLQIMAEHPAFSALTLATDLASARELMAQSSLAAQFDFVLLDLELPDGDGIDLLPALKPLQAPMMVYTVLEETEKLLNAYSAGASSYTLKTDDPDQLREVIVQHFHQRSGFPLSPKMAQRLLDSRLRPPELPPHPQPLSPRQIDVLQLLSTGLYYNEIALQLDISENTVVTHVRAIFNKLEVSNRTAAVHRGRQLRILEL